MRKGDVFLREKAKTIAVAGCLLALIIICYHAGEHLKRSALNDRETSGSVSGSGTGTLIVLDAGHGGIDVGKMGVNGAEEKEINLKISIKIKKLLTKEGISVLMTRSSDDRLGDTQKDDLKERVRIMNKERPALAVSVHQNSYKGAEVRGPQVFYYTDSDAGRSAARILQAELNQIEPAYSREEKGNDSYYILKNAKAPAVIIECGFLSNPEEAEMLVTDEYQDMVAGVVAEGIKKYID